MSSNNQIQKNEPIKKVHILVTGCLRTFSHCFLNWKKYLIDPNDKYEFIFSFNVPFESKYNSVHEQSVYIESIIKPFKLHNISITSNVTSISDKQSDHYIDSSDLRNLNAYHVMYRSFVLYNEIEHTINDSVICIRMRPDIELSNSVSLSSFYEEYDNCLVYVSSTHFNNNSWFCHKRDWDYMYISNKLGMYLACVEYFKQIPKTKTLIDFSKQIDIGQTGTWIKTTSDRSIIATQKLVESLYMKSMRVAQHKDVYARILRS